MKINLLPHLKSAIKDLDEKWDISQQPEDYQKGFHEALQLTISMIDLLDQLTGDGKNT